MEYLPSKKLGHIDGLSRLIPRNSETFMDSIIAALRAEEKMNCINCMGVINNSGEDKVIHIKRQVH